MTFGMRSSARRRPDRARISRAGAVSARRSREPLFVDAPASSSRRSTRAVSVTWPREMPLRIASRTSPSHFASSDGSLIDGLKNR